MMTSPDLEDAPSPNSLFDEDILETSFPDYVTQPTTIPTHTCECGYTSVHKEDFDRHRFAYSARVTIPVDHDMLGQGDTVQKMPRLAPLQALPSKEYLPQPSLLPSSASQQHDPRSPRVTRTPPAFQGTHVLTHDFYAEANQHQPVPQHQPIYSNFLNDPSTPQPTYAQPQLGYIPADPYLSLHYRNSGYASQREMERNQVPSTFFPFPLSHIDTSTPTYHAAQPAPPISPPNRSATSSVVSLTTNTFKRMGRGMGSFLRGSLSPRGRGRGRGRNIKTETHDRLSHSPDPVDSDMDISDTSAAKKRKKIQNDKQRKCRQAKADNQEALEAEVQRLRIILRALGGCGDGEPIRGTNWF